jgi:hypothetical protein
MKEFLGISLISSDLDKFLENIQPLWNINNYDKRKQWLMGKAGLTKDYSFYKPTQEQIDKFASAARRQISKVMEWIA